jgi:hypothetical protein
MKIVVWVKSGRWDDRMNGELTAEMFLTTAVLLLDIHLQIHPSALCFNG